MLAQGLQYLSEVPVGGRFRCPDSGLTGTVLRHGIGSTTVKLDRTKPVVIHGETVAHRQEVTHISPSTEVVLEKGTTK